jgi:serine protease Do
MSILRYAVLVLMALAGAVIGPRDAPARDVPPELADVVAKLVPSVVNITTWKMMPPPDGNGPPIKTRIFGSGSIVRPDGFIVTARHVVKDGQGFYVTLSDGRLLIADLIVEGEAIDVAVLKVKSEDPLPAVKIGDSDDLRQGDTVIAIGNPLGLSSTVTSGIVSALDRNIQQGPFDAFVQTDAAINPGNSGGGLFNAKGELIGVNDAIYQAEGSAGGGSIGLGFAIPINDAKFAVVHMMEPDWVGPGWLGASIQQVTGSIQQAMGMTDPVGAIVAQVNPGTPAAQAGLRVGDVITAFDGQEQPNVRKLRRAIAVTPPGTTVALTVWRDRQPITLHATLGKTPGFKPPLAGLQASAARPARTAPRTPEEIGLTLATATDELRQRFKLAPTQGGVVVVDVAENSEAWMLGVNPGNVVVRAGDQPIATLDDLKAKVLAEFNKGSRYLMVLFLGARGYEWIAFPFQR